MNIVNIQIKRKEGFSYYKNSHRRYDLTLKVRNMNKGQVQILETAIQKVCIEILPEREGTPYGEAIAKMLEPQKSGRPKGSKNKKKKDVKNDK